MRNVSASHSAASVAHLEPVTRPEVPAISLEALGLRIRERAPDRKEQGC